MGVILFTNWMGMIKRGASLDVLTAEVDFNIFILTQFTNKGSIIKSSINLNKTLLPFWHWDWILEYLNSRPLKIPVEFRFNNKKEIQYVQTLERTVDYKTKPDQRIQKS